MNNILVDNYKKCMTDYTKFNGRAGRSEFWYFILACFLINLAASILDSILGFGIFVLITGLGQLIPSLAVGARRLHDTGKSGWLQLLYLIPLVGFIVLIVLFAQEGSKTPNGYDAA